MIPYGKQNINSSDIKNVVKVLKSKFITQGPVVYKFEKKISKYTGSKFAIAANSASSALHIACLALGLKKNDYFWTVPNTFVASANCGLHCGAKIDFIDIDENTWNISISKLEKKLKIAKKEKKLPKILIPIHFAGKPSEQKKIKSLSKKYKFSIIEDASHSLGSKHYGEKVGSCKWSDITIFSFHPVKPITTGEGGMALTNNAGLYKKLMKLRNHGITKDINEMERKEKSKWYYEQQLLGFNFRMNDMEAALGLSQLNRLKYFIKKRNLIAKKYFNELKNLPLQLPSIENYNYSSYHLFVVRFKSALIKNYDYKKFFQKLINYKIGINLHYLPVHLHPYFKKLGFKKGNFQNSEKYSNEAISLPIYHDLKKKDQDYIIKKLKKLFNAPK